jgi:hypothetical protein
MAYTIVKSDGTLLTTIPDGTINTTSTSLGLPGRNYAGYGQTLDTNFVHMLENFADTVPPPNPMKGQLWYDTNTNELKICPNAGQSNALAWFTLTSTSPEGNITFTNITATGTVASDNVTVVNTLTTIEITTGGPNIAGTIEGNWTLTANSRLQATYADLAERFEADQALEAGTVVEIGGAKEITAVKYELSEDVFGVVSNTAAYLMNAGAGNDYSHPAVAVSGRVHVKTMGKVKKGERLVSAGNGYARAARTGEANAFNTIGRALCDKNSDGPGLVEAIVIIR